MTKVRTPRTTAAATALLERYAVLDSQVELIESVRNGAIAKANAAADAKQAPLLVEKAAIAAALEPWWADAKAELTNGKRKSVELGGCIVGTKMTRAVVTFTKGDDDAALRALQAHRWAKPYIHVKYSVHRMATLAGLDGKHAAGLKELGFVKQDGEDQFFVKRAEQGGTVAS